MYFLFGLLSGDFPLTARVWWPAFYWPSLGYEKSLSIKLVFLIGEKDSWTVRDCQSYGTIS